MVQPFRLALCKVKGKGLYQIAIIIWLLIFRLRREIMNSELICYKTMPVWDKATIPAAVLSQHNTQVGTYGKLRVLRGRLKFYELQEDGTVLAEHN